MISSKFISRLLLNNKIKKINTPIQFKSIIQKRSFSTNRNKVNISKNSSNDRGPVTFLSLGIMAIVGGGIMMYYQIEKEERAQKVASDVVTVGKASLGGPWSLVDEDGIPRTDAYYKGQFQLLYFGFTYCPDICPNELVKIGKIIDSLKKKGVNVKPIFISVDPARDTIGQLKNYSQDFHPDMSFLTGTRDQIAEATRAYRVYFSKANEHDDDEDDYLVDHSIVMYFLSPDGTFLEFFTQRAQVSDIVKKISSHTNPRP
jgi:protein SCO1/2